MGWTAFRDAIFGSIFIIYLFIYLFTHLFIYLFIFIYHKIQITIKQDSYTKANESGEEAQNETTGLINIGLPQSKNKVNSDSKTGSKVKYYKASISELIT